MGSNPDYLLKSFLLCNGCGDFGCAILDQRQIFVFFQISYTKYPKVSTTLLIFSFEKNLWNYPTSFFNANFQIEDDQCQCQYCDRFFPDLDCVQSHILEKHCEHCKFCNMMIQGNFEDHLYNSHYKQKLESVIPQQTRGCSGKKIGILLPNLLWPAVIKNCSI